MTPFKITMAVTAMPTLLMVLFALQRIPVPADPITVAVAAEEQFDDAWTDTMQPLALRKADLEKTLATTTEPKPVAAERILLDVSTKVPPVIVSFAEDKPRHRRHAEHRDVCPRHGKHKVVTRGGRSWRCR